MKYFEVKNLCYSYYKKPLCLKDINFSLQKNEKILILAKEGQGKTTLLKTASLFDDKSFGAVFFEDKGARKIDDKDKKFSLILSEPILLSGTIKKNFEFLCKQENMDMLSDASLNAYLRLFKICGNAGTKVCQLTNEDKVKLCLVRSFVKNPNIVFLDDVLNSLQIKNKDEIRDDVKMLINNKTAIVTMSEKSYKENKEFVGELNFDKILYLNLAESKNYKTIDEFKEDLPDLDSLSFFDDEKSYEASIVYENETFFFVYNELKFKFNKMFLENLLKLKIESGEAEDVVFCFKDNADIMSLSNEEFEKRLLNKSLCIFCKLDGTRVI